MHNPRKSLLPLLMAVLFLSNFCVAQDMYLLNLRDSYYSPDLVAFEPKACLIPAALLVDSSASLLQENWKQFDPISIPELYQIIKDQRVALCIHGMAKSYTAANKDLLNNYWNLMSSASNKYDVVVGVTWPGESHLGVGAFAQANTLAKKSGRLLGEVLEDWSGCAASLDVITHSMGSKVLLQALKGHDTRINHAFFLAPSIFRNSLRPWRKWHKESRSIEQLVVFHSEHDYAFSWTSIQHLGLGYKGTQKITRKMANYYQVNCSSIVNQNGFTRLPKNRFRSRSNHSMYNQCEPVFSLINQVLSGKGLCEMRSCELVP